MERIPFNNYRLSTNFICFNQPSKKGLKISSSIPQIKEINSVYSNAISARAKAHINMHNNETVHRFVLPDRSSDSEVFDYIRAHILEQARIYEDETTKELKACKNTKSSGLSPFNKLKELEIPNFALTSDQRGVRGSSMLSPKRRKHLESLNEAGIRRIIDLRTEAPNSFCNEICAKNNLEYFRFPIAFDEKWSKESIEQIPDFVKQLQKGDYYIGCASGLHRTDTALAINYFFNPKQTIAPKLEAGMGKNKMITIKSKVFQTLNDICYTDKTKQTVRLSEDFAAKLGWKSLKDLLEELPKRRIMLDAVNKVL